MTRIAPARPLRFCRGMATDHVGHRTCPFCGVWMVVRKADSEGAANDTFECALCRTVIYVPRQGEQPSEPNVDAGRGTRA